MAGCDGWITIKILELIFATFCMIYKRVSDYEANKLFYFLQKFSREWPLLNNITWEENGAIFTDITYGGYIIIIIGLIVGHCSGELQRCRKMESFFLIVGALLFIAAGSLELAALESVEERLVDNAAILGVFSLVTGFLFIIDLLSASKRRKRERIKMIGKNTQAKLTQTEENRTGYMNGNIPNGKSYPITDLQNGSRIPRNGVKLLPSSPIIQDNGTAPVTNMHNGYPGTIVYPAEPPIVDSTEIKTHEGRIRSTESFLRSEKGLYPKFRKTPDGEPPNGNFFIPAGYVLVPADQFQGKNKPKSDSGIGDSPTPPGYAKIIPDAKGKPGYVIIPIDQKEVRKDDPRKLQSPTVTTPVKGSQELFYISGGEASLHSPNLPSVSLVNSSDVSDVDEPRARDKHDGKSRKHQKYSSEYPDTRSQKFSLHSEDSSDEPKLSYPSEVHFRPESRHSLRSLHGSREWRYYPKGKVNEAYSDDRDNDFPSVSRRSSPYRSRASSPDKPKSILRFDYGRSSKKENGLYFPKDVRYDSLDSQKIAEDLRNLREITKSDVDLTRNLEKENKVLKERLRQEKEEKEKLKYDLEDRKKLEQMKDSEEEKNRRISEREEQYFGIKDLKESALQTTPKIKQLEKYFRKESEKASKGAKEVNEGLKEKYLEHKHKAAKEAQEFQDLIDERFHFLESEEKKRKKKEIPLPQRGEPPGRSQLTESKSSPDLTHHSKKLDSDETNYSQSTDDEIRLRVETPGSASYKSEALFWLGNEPEDRTKSSSPATPVSPGYVLYTAQNWPESPSPKDRFQFSAKEAQDLTIGTPPKTTVLDRVKPDFSSQEEKKNSQKLRLLEFEEVPESAEKSTGLKKGLLVRKVDFPSEPAVEIKKPAVVTGSTSTWKKWLYPKPKLQQTRSVPN